MPVPFPEPLHRHMEGELVFGEGMIWLRCNAERGTLALGYDAVDAAMLQRPLLKTNRHMGGGVCLVDGLLVWLSSGVSGEVGRAAWSSGPSNPGVVWWCTTIVRLDLVWIETEKEGCVDWRGEKGGREEGLASVFDGADGAVSLAMSHDQLCRSCTSELRILVLRLSQYRPGTRGEDKG